MSEEENTVTLSDEEAYADFAKRYGRAKTDYEFARVLSGRLRDLDKRAKAANRRADACADLLRTATAFIEELKAFGYGESSEKALPGTYDPFVQAVDALKD